MDPGLADAIEGLTVERYAELMARIDVAVAAARPEGQPAEAEARRAAPREAGIPAEVWARAQAGFQRRMNDEVTLGATRGGVPPRERYPLLTRYGVVYAAEKKRLLEAPARAEGAKGSP